MGRKPEPGLVWHRGRPCDAGNCVEIAVSGDMVLVRSSADPAHGVTRLTREEWREFLLGVKEGCFDLI